MSLVYNSNKFQYAVSQFLPFGEVRRGSSFNAFNSMKAYSYNGERFGYYGYDASGERTYKIDFDAVFAKVGGVITVQALNIQNIFFYPNGYMNININGEYTKHYYADALRIASKIGSGASGLDLCSDAMAVNNNYFAYDYLNERVMQQYEIMRVELNEVVVPMQDIQNIDPMPHPNFCNLGSGGQEPDLFFYHPDHLGSTGMVTDNSSNITQGFLYAPFGEIITEFNPSWESGRIPKYAFNAKELDEENNMYYYSARYYAPPTFISRDDKFEKFPTINPYCYTKNNPLKYVDPDGKENWPALLYANKNMKNYTKHNNYRAWYEGDRWSYNSEVPGFAACYEAIWHSYMASADKNLKEYFQSGFTNKNNAFIGRNLGKQWFMAGNNLPANENGLSRSFETDIMKGEIGDIVFMAGHAAILAGLPEIKEENGNKSVTIKVLTTTSKGFKVQTITFEEDNSSETSGWNAFEGYGQLHGVNKPSEADIQKYYNESRNENIENE